MSFCSRLVIHTKCPPKTKNVIRKECWNILILMIFIVTPVIVYHLFYYGIIRLFAKQTSAFQGKKQSCRQGIAGIIVRLTERVYQIVKRIVA